MRGLAEKEHWAGGEAPKTKLTYSHTSDSSRAGPALGRAIVHNPGVNLIGGTKTRTGLKVKAVLDTNHYEIDINVSDEQLEEVRLRRHKVHPTWNYTISPRKRK
jgi:hypothetical protein